MKSLRQILVLALSLTVALPQVPSRAQSAPQQPPPPPAQSDAQLRIRVNSNLVVLPVTVKDGAGNLVPDLHKDEFRIFEDNVEQNIDVFSADSFPLSMVVLIDNDLKQKDADEVESSLKSIIAGMSANDEAFICRFDQFFHPGKGFTNDQDKLLTELKRTHLDEQTSAPATSASVTNGPSINGHSATSDAPNINGGLIAIKGQPTKALDDAVYDSAQLLHDRGRDRRKIILLVSDGVNGGKKVNTNPYDNVVKELLRENAAVYSVAVSSAFLERKLSRLVDYAHDSGGDIYFAARRSSLEKLYSQVTEEARTQYTLAYVPRGTNRNLESHNVEVRVKREGLNIKTRDKYYSGAVGGANP
ncbi:MAG TPA: VWA domain-containing protein [Candidatus Acidoferrum sp.]|jgi:Ca-activated chloride channel family protein